MGFLELTDIQKMFGDVTAVKDFNLAAEHGEFVSFLGPSGCGKTTTLRMIAGFEKPDRRARSPSTARTSRTARRTSATSAWSSSRTRCSRT